MLHASFLQRQVGVANARLDVEAEPAIVIMAVGAMPEAAQLQHSPSTCLCQKAIGKSDTTLPLVTGTHLLTKHVAMI